MSRVVLVTGGGTGIGMAIAARFAALEDSVIITGRRPGVLAQALAGLDGDVTSSCFDAADPDAVELFTATLTTVDVLVNNAGGQRHFEAETAGASSLCEIAAAWQANYAANVVSAVLMTTACRNKLTVGGSVISIGSIAAEGSGSYGAAKAALASWNADLARQLGPEKVTANVVAPGYITDTEFFGDKLSPARRSAMIEATCTQRAGTPDDIARTVEFLASPGARHITGQVLAVNGGARTTR